VILFDLVERLSFFEFAYTEEGFLPLHVLFDPAVSKGWDWSVFYLHNHSLWSGVLFICLFIATVCFILGYKTRIATIALWALWVSLKTRNPYDNYGVDTLIAVTLFWSMWIPLGARFSIDTKRLSTNSATHTSGLPIFCLLLQLALVYWFNAISKADPCWRVDYSAIELVMGLDSFATPIGKSLLEYPALLNVLTRITLWIEELCPLMLFIPFMRDKLRFITAIIMIGFHVLGIGLTMYLGIFPFLSASIWLVILPSFVWKWVDKASAPEEISYSMGWKTKALLSFLLTYDVLWNIKYTRPYSKISQAFSEFNFIAELTHLDQKWTLFAPKPRVIDYWIVPVSIDEQGQEVNSLTRTPVTLSAPDDFPSYYQNGRLRALYTNICRLEEDQHALIDSLERAWSIDRVIRLSMDENKKIEVME